MPYLLQAAFEKIDRDTAFLGNCLREMLQSVDPHAETLARYIPEGREPLPRLPEAPAAARGVTQLLSIWFQILNLVEENTVMMMRRQREEDHGCQGEPGLWGAVLSELLQHGHGADDISRGLERYVVEPVLTAHPTEAKRPAVLHAHRQLYLGLFELENTTWTRLERETIRGRIVATLERLWRTGELAHAKPTVEEEFDSILHYLTRVFPGVLPQLDERFRHAWSQLGLDEARLRDPESLPGLRFGNWVGGDRDGHDLVTADTTRHVLRALRRGALGVLLAAVERMASGLRLSGRLQPAPSELWDAIHELAVEQDAAFPSGSALEEPWHTYGDLIARRIRAEMQSLDAGAQATLSRSDLVVCLERLTDSLRAVGADRLVDSSVVPVRRLLDVFGLHLASLDIRQNSGVHDRAIEDLLRAHGRQDVEFSSWNERRRREFLLQELRAPEPWRHTRGELGPSANATLDCLRVVAGHLRRHGREGIGELIVSMTRDVSDLLAVTLLGREAGLAQREDGWWVLPVPVTPLFETLQDLGNAPTILQEAMETPPLRRALHAVAPSGPRDPGRLPPQVVMIGYSDSNKDGGYLASQWALHQAQRSMAAVSRKIGVNVVFFHGRGGTVSRGAGPTHRFLEALPLGSLAGSMRLTEQGETIAQKYANQGTAAYNLELLQAGALHVGLLHQQGDDLPVGLARTMEGLARRSADLYRELLETPGFLEYWSQATPVDVLEHGRIGSRPVRRRGLDSLDDLRAIPWVFSWMQSRHFLTAWYGAGRALLDLADGSPAEFDRLHQSLATWPFWRYVFYNLETSWSSVDTDLVRSYASLVQDPRIRTACLEAILAEHDRCGEAIERLAGQEWTRKRPRMVRTLALRAEGLRALHLRQIDLLTAWRPTVGEEAPAGDSALLEELQLTVRAISAGLRAVG